MASTRVGAVDEHLDPSHLTAAQQQAASIGATIGPDGWWYKDGQKLSHAQADQLVQAAGTAQGGLGSWGRGRGSLADMTVAPWAADALRMAAEAGGSIIGIPPQVTGAVVNNVGHGPLGNLGQVLGRGAMGALQGATVGGATQGALNAASGVGNTLTGAAKGALNGVTHPFGSYTGSGGPIPVTSIAPGTDLSQVGNASNPTGGAGLSWGANGLVHGPGSTTPGASGGTNGQPGATSGGIPSSVASLLGNVPGIGELLSSGANFLGGNGGLNALAVAQGLNAAQLGQQSSDYAKQAGNSAVGAWDAKAPLRVAGIAGMLKPPVADTSSLGQIAARGNPFANKPTPVGSL